FSRHVEEFRYHVQDAMYREGYLKEFGEYPLFVFIAVSETINCGRYPVRVFELESQDVEAGYDEFRKNLTTYHECIATGNWGGVERLARPEWARRRDSL
ncbi:PD-(D/E)XK nuclease-like domain-containing protein, partial [Tatumella punctata]